MITAAIILIITYIGIAFTRLPWVKIDRPSAALAGAVLMLLTGVLTLDEAVDAINFDTLALLLGMMLLVVVLQKAGFFTFLATKTVEVASTPRKLLVSVVLATALCSAFLVNDVVVLLFTPIVIAACRIQRVNPVPYLIGEAMASNIGSTATIVGNPQNMLIGIASEISFSRFFAHLAPIAFLSTLVLLVVLYFFYRKQLLPLPSNGPLFDSTQVVSLLGAEPLRPRMLIVALPVLAGVVVAFFVSSFAGLSIPLIGLTAGVGAMLVSRLKPSEVIGGVDWILLLFFGGLFVVIGGAEQVGLLDEVLQRVNLHPSAGGIVSIHLFSSLVSQAVSNVPLTILLLPILKTVPGDVLWISLAAGATLGGNMTLVGAVANLIVAEQAKREGVLMGFWEFLKVGLVVTLLTVPLSVGVLWLEFEIGFLG